MPAGSAADIVLLSSEPLCALGGLALLGMNVCLIIACGVLVLVVMGPRQREGGASSHGASGTGGARL